MNKYFVYILKCADESLYTGIATDIQRRIDEHNNSDKGAKYTRARRPVNLLYSEEFPNRSEAQKREYFLKQLTKSQKIDLINLDKNH